MEYYLLFFSIAFPLLGLCVQLGQGPHDELLEKRFIIPETSKLRSVIPFRETPSHPFIYLKIIPFLVSIVISLAILILYSLSLFFPRIMMPIIVHPITIVTTTLLGFIFMIYAGIMNMI